MNKKIVLAVMMSAFVVGACSQEPALQGEDESAGNPPVVSAPEEIAEEMDADGWGRLDLLGGTVGVPFSYEMRYDRVQFREERGEQRQVFLEVLDAALGVKEIGDLITSAFEAAGFVREYQRMDDDGALRSKFSKENVASVFVLVRPDGIGPTLHSEGAVASVFMTQMLETNSESAEN